MYFSNNCQNYYHFYSAIDKFKKKIIISKYEFKYVYYMIVCLYLILSKAFL